MEKFFFCCQVRSGDKIAYTTTATPVGL